MKLSTIKRTPIKKKPKTPLKKLQDRLLDLWSLIVKQKAGFKCEVCHREKWLVVLNSHHIIGKRNLTVKWDIRNGCCLCVGCHEFSKESAKNDSQWFMDWLKTHRPEDDEYLRVKKNERFDKDYQRIENELKESK